MMKPFIWLILHTLWAWQVNIYVYNIAKLSAVELAAYENETLQLPYFEI